ncbi:DUF2164 domain-containing protein [Hyphomonas sp.]|uniref:DUF2164 domain-containing protein n=1 Tax=Hyphomonas sp. TaxID=87 RepID=UPI0025C6EA9E|nr:DUF2164 domain-containing protein [Hyphomonas sp.]MBI1400785.1 DUF2164 family protein [Hyphomonas sp.]
MKQIKLSPERRQRLIEQVQTLFARDFDETLSSFRAGEIVDRMTALIGPGVYNQAVEDVRAHLQARLDDLNGEVFVDDPA